jgi:hypothetical protein
MLETERGFFALWLRVHLSLSRLPLVPLPGFFLPLCQSPKRPTDTDRERPLSKVEH